MKSAILKACVAAGAMLGVTRAAFGQDEASQMLRVYTCERAGVIHFYAQNLELAPVTASFNVGLLNLKSSAEFPYTTNLAGNQTVELFTLSPFGSERWKYNETHSSIVGSAIAVHDDSFVYLLPYAPGSSYRVTQGYHGRFSHRGPDEFAVDWKMPVGTPVFAARGGIVVKSRDDMDQGGADRKYEQYANSILIEHDDGTIGIYGHLKKGGNRVIVGDHIHAGDLLGLSGNTGFSDGPHLHFSVFKARDGFQRASIPVKFRSADEGAVTLVSGHSYTAVGIPWQMTALQPAAANR